MTETALQELADKLSISELAARFNRAADGVDPDAFHDLFVAEGVVVMRGASVGERTYKGPGIGQLVAPSPAQRVHLTTDALIDFDGDRAVHTCSLLLLTRARLRGLAALFTGRYTDEMVRTPEGWRFARRVVDLDFANKARCTLVEVDA
jgi:hypothetical protein